LSSKGTFLSKFHNPEHNLQRLLVSGGPIVLFLTTIRTNLRDCSSRRHQDSVAELREEKLMLVLTRKPNEEVVIGGNIRIKVLEIKGNRVRLGICAPDQVPVMRSELVDAMSNSYREMEFAIADSAR
jgi:carbon storage regulator